VDSQQSRRLSAEARQVCAQKNKNCRYAPTSFCDSQHRPALGPIRLETVSRHMPSHASSILSSVLLCAFVFKNPSLSDFHAGQALVSQKSLRVALARFLAGQRQVRSSVGPSRIVQHVENIDSFRY
jgi:hypothetical protein